MGRYFFGDIEGKFWFAVQSSDAASRFSKSAECEPSTIEYFFDDGHLDEVRQELKRIEDKLGDSLAKFHWFFEGNPAYNNIMLTEAGLPIEFLEDYADYLLGKKIEKSIVDMGQCSFSAEL
jgi:hypothetical protein